jgi:hypothetical protein
VASIHFSLKGIQRSTSIAALLPSGYSIGSGREYSHE